MVEKARAPVLLLARRRRADPNARFIFSVSRSRGGRNKKPWRGGGLGFRRFRGNSFPPPRWRSWCEDCRGLRHIPGDRRSCRFGRRCAASPMARDGGPASTAPSTPPCALADARLPAAQSRAEAPPAPCKSDVQQRSLPFANPTPAVPRDLANPFTPLINTRRNRNDL
jgi:hypothetical protein